MILVSKLLSALVTKVSPKFVEQKLIKRNEFHFKVLVIHSSIMFRYVEARKDNKISL